MRTHDPTSLPGTRRTDAGERTLVIDADDRELAPLRADLDRWLDSSTLPPDAHDNIVLVASELIAKVLVADRGDEPIEVRCRYTHSLAVIEVAQRGTHASSSTDLEEAIAADEIASDILRSLTSRVSIASNAGRSSIRCSLSLCD